MCHSRTLSERATIIGVDPDPFGGIAVVEGERLRGIWDLPVERNQDNLYRHSLHGIARCISEATGNMENVTAFVERATGGAQMRRNACVQQGIGVGICMGTIAAYGHDVYTFHPNEWRSALGLQNSKHGKQSNIALANALFPGLVESTLQSHSALRRASGRADAALVAGFARIRQAALTNEYTSLIDAVAVRRFLSQKKSHWNLKHCL